MLASQRAGRVAEAQAWRDLITLPKFANADDGGLLLQQSADQVRQPGVTASLAKEYVGWQVTRARQLFDELQHTVNVGDGTALYAESKLAEIGDLARFPAPLLQAAGLKDGKTLDTAPPQIPAPYAPATASPRHRGMARTSRGDAAEPAFARRRDAAAAAARALHRRGAEGISQRRAGPKNRHPARIQGGAAVHAAGAEPGQRARAGLAPRPAGHLREISRRAGTEAGRAGEEHRLDPGPKRDRKKRGRRRLDPAGPFRPERAAFRRLRRGDRGDGLRRARRAEQFAGGGQGRALAGGRVPPARRLHLVRFGDRDPGHAAQPGTGDQDGAQLPRRPGRAGDQGAAGPRRVDGPACARLRGDPEEPRRVRGAAEGLGLARDDRLHRVHHPGAGGDWRRS